MVAVPNNKSWLIAAWPGMGSVAVIAASHLVRRLGMKPFEELSAGSYFDVEQVNVVGGIIAPARLPRNLFFRIPNSTDDARTDLPAREQHAAQSGDKLAGGTPAEVGADTPGAPSARDLIVFIGDAQPSNDGYRFAQAILEHAGALGVERVVTFASMASQLHPSQDPRVFGAATDHDTLIDLKRLEVQTLSDGQIGGMNGVLLGAAAERGMSGLCLLGEIPFFAAGVPNPKSAKAVLEVFGVLSGIPVDVSDLARDAQTVDRALIELLEKMREDARRKENPEREDDDEASDEAWPAPASSPTDAPGPKKVEQRALEPAARARLEQLFTEAAADRSKAVQLKEHLDRLGVFAQYENRFLDIFRRAE